MKYNITPVAKPRMTQRDKRLPKRACVAKYHAFCDELRANKVELADNIYVIFYLPMPKSWSKKKRADMLARPHQQVPDLDNCIKSLLDGVLVDDSHVWAIRARKFWANEGGIEIL